MRVNKSSMHFTHRDTDLRDEDANDDTTNDPGIALNESLDG